jgi:Flp pilus assembly protein TadG
MDESKGISVTGGNGCTVHGSPQKTGAGAYTVSVVIPSEAEDGNCDIGVASTANGAYMAAEIPYSADPDYFKKAAPAIYAFANSKTWTFKTSSGKTETQTVMNVQNSASRVAAMTKGSDDSVGVFGFTPPDQIAGTYAGCVLQGTLSNGVATLKPILESDDCKKVGTVTVKAGS